MWAVGALISASLMFERACVCAAGERASLTWL